MKSEVKNSAFWALGATVALGICFLLSRYIFLYMHKMTQWPFILFVSGLVVIVVAAIFNGRKTMISTPIGYIVGFVLGMLFNADIYDTGGGLLNNAWIIWTISFVVIIIASVGTVM